MTYLQAIVLGVVQGLAEFLPISSSGHLALTQRLFGLHGNSDSMLLFNVCTHVGTVLATLVVFWGAFVSLIKTFVRDIRQVGPGKLFGPKPPAALHIVFMAVISFVVTGVIAVLFKDDFEDAFANTTLIGVMLLLTAGLLTATLLVKHPKRGWRQLKIPGAILIGLAQACAILPGISRSGATICMATYYGMRRKWAGQYSFLIAAPAILGALVLKLRDMPGSMEQVQWGPVLAGSVVATVVGVFALRLLMAAVVRAKLAWFALYCAVVGVVVIVLSFTDVLAPLPAMPTP